MTGKKPSKNPWGITFDHNGNLHIAAYGSNCIKVFSPDGCYISTYGTGIVNQPAGIAINSEGVIAISEYGGSNRLWVYDRNQTKLLGMTQGAFSNGSGIASDADDYFWVAGSVNNCIYKSKTDHTILCSTCTFGGLLLQCFLVNYEVHLVANGPDNLTL